MRSATSSARTSWGICWGQFASQAVTLKTIACSTRLVRRVRDTRQELWIVTDDPSGALKRHLSVEAEAEPVEGDRTEDIASDAMVKEIRFHRIAREAFDFERERRSRNGDAADRIR